MTLKKKDLIELKKGGSKAIDQKLSELRKNLGTFVLEAKRGQAKNPKQGKIIRRSIAQLLTLSHELSQLPPSTSPAKSKGNKRK